LVGLVDKKDPKWIDLFLEIIEKAYLGSDFQYDKQTFRLDPTLVMPADFQRRTIDSHSSYDSLLKALDPTFKSLATSEVYRAKTGWIAKGLSGHNGHKIRRITVGNDVFLLPELSKQPAVGIDTSGCENNDSIIVICSIPDYEGAHVWLEKHLKLPKDLRKQEFHWTKLNPAYRQLLLDKFDLTLSICCDALLVIKTNAFIERRGKTENIFTNLVEGCFSGYESDPLQKNLRPNLKKRFFSVVNGVQIHCDSDFTPLTPEKVVRLLVQTLAKQNGGHFEEYTPLFANLRSHESKPIQIADIVAGMVKNRIENKGIPECMKVLPFDLRKLKRYSDNPPKTYFWLA
jgi:hypothetical protein